MARPKRHPKPFVRCAHCINGRAVEGLDSGLTIDALTTIGPCVECNGTGWADAIPVGRLPVGSIVLDIEGNTYTLTRKGDMVRALDEAGGEWLFRNGAAVKLVRLCHASFTVPGAR